MPDEVSENLSLEVGDALQAIQQISDALDQVVTQFQVGLAQALETLTSVSQDVPPLADSLDVAGLGTAIDSALAEVSQPIPIEADTTGLDAALADALDQPRDVPVDGDTSGLVAGIDEATSVGATVPVDADVTAARDAIDSLDNEPITLSAEVDVAGAQDQIDQLTQSVTGLGSSSGKGGEELAGLEGAVVGIKAATGAARGEVGGLSEGISSLGGSTAVAVGGFAALGGFIGETTKLAADAQAQNKRFEETFGSLASAVREIDVGGLNTDLETLGKTSGTTAADLEATASRIGLLGQSSGASNDTIVSTTQNLLALGATISVNNPRLGDAASVTDRLTNAFARGGRALAPFGIALSSAQINAEALKETGKATAAELTLFEKSTAGANLALATFGDTLGTKFNDGAQNAQVQLRALKVQLEETLVAIGGPLLQPLVDSLTELLPVAQEVGIVLGKLAEIVLPALAAAVPLISPLSGILGLIGDGLGGVADFLNIIPGPLLTVVEGVAALTAAAYALGPALEAVAIAGGLSLGPAGWVVLGLGALAALGGAMHLFGTRTQEVKVDTASLAGAFNDAAQSGTDFANTFTGLNAAVDDYLKKQLVLGKSGEQGIDAANRLGLSLGQIRTAITGSSEDYAAFLRNIQNVTGGTKEQQAANDALENAIRGAGNALNTQAETTLVTAVQQGVLTEAQLKGAEAIHTAADGNIDYIDTLRDLTPAIDAATAATNANAQTLATTSPIFADLAKNFAQGKLTVDTLTASLAQFGFTGTGATDEAKKIGDALTNLLKSEGALPQVGSVMDDFAATVKKDFQQVSDDVSKGTGNVQADLAKLANDSDPQRFAENLNAQTANILKFTANLRTLVAEGFGGLAASLAEKGPEVAGGLAASLASAPAKARVAQGAEDLSQASRQAFDTFLRAHFPELAQLGEQQGSAIAGGAVAGLNGAGDQISAAVAGLGVGASEHFHPDFSHAVTAQVAAAQQALAGDTTISQAAGQKALDAVASFSGPLTLKGAAELALKTAHDAIQKDPTLAAAAGTKGQETKDAFKPDIAAAVEKQFGLGAGTIQRLTSIALAAGNSGFAVGVAFDSGLAEGINDKNALGGVTSAAAGAAAAAEAAAKVKLGIKSPSTVGISIGRDFTKGVSIGLVDAIPDAAVAAKTIADQLVKRLQDELAAGIAKVNASTATASALTTFATSATGHLPTIGSDISSFTATVAADLATQQQALDGVHKAYAQYTKDQAEVARLTKLTDQALAAAVHGTQAQKDAATALQQQLTQAKNQLVQDQGQIAGAAKTLSEAQKALAHASDPATFISNLNRQTQASQRFLADIAKLKKEGFNQLAKELLDAGPDAAGKLADAFADNAGKAKQANAAIVAADTFASNFTKQIEALFGGSTVQKVATAAGTNIGLGINAGINDVIKFNPAATNKLTVPSLAAPLQQVTLPVGVASAGVQQLNLDLTITTEDGQKLKANVSIPVPPPGASLVQQTRAQVKAL